MLVIGYWPLRLKFLICLLQGCTALMHAAWPGHLDMVKYLLSIEADKAAQNHQVMQQHPSGVRNLLGRTARTSYLAAIAGLCNLMCVWA